MPAIAMDPVSVGWGRWVITPFYAGSSRIPMDGMNAPSVRIACGVGGLPRQFRLVERFVSERNLRTRGPLLDFLHELDWRCCWIEACADVRANDGGDSDGQGDRPNAQRMSRISSTRDGDTETRIEFANSK